MWYRKCLNIPVICWTESNLKFDWMLRKCNLWKKNWKLWSQYHSFFLSVFVFNFKFAKADSSYQKILTLHLFLRTKSISLTKLKRKKENKKKERVRDFELKFNGKTYNQTYGVTAVTLTVTFFLLLYNGNFF